MKKAVIFGLACLIGGAAVPVLAGQQNEQLAQCKAELAAIYGDDARLKLQSIQSGRSGKMRIKVIPADGDSTLVNCWLDTDGIPQLVDGDGVALRAPGYDGGDTVSLND